MEAYISGQKNDVSGVTEQFLLFTLAEGTLHLTLRLHVHARINDFLEKPKGCLKFPDCSYSLGPAAFPCCFGMAVGSETPFWNPTNLPPTVSAYATAEAGRSAVDANHTFMLSELKKVRQNSDADASMESKTTLSKAFAPICKQRWHEIQFTA